MEALKIRQLFKLSRILYKMGLKVNLTDFIFGEKFDKQLKEMDSTISNKQDLVYINIITFIMENMYKAENELISLFSELNNVDVKEVEKYTIDEFLVCIDKLVKCALPKNYRIIAEFALKHYKKKILQILQNKQQ